MALDGLGIRLPLRGTEELILSLKRLIMDSTHDLSRLTVNMVTAGPWLRLLLALRGQELPSYDPEVCWDVFKHFARFPAEYGHELLSFQGTWTEEDPADRPNPP